MKKISISVMLFAFLTLFATTVNAALVVSTEDSVATCIDGLDNDEDTLVDYADSDCGAVVIPAAIPALTLENTLSVCTDGLDNDEDTLVDYADSDCSSAVATSTIPALSVENTTASCTDGLDNDEDTLVDYADSDCPAPTPVVTLPSTGGSFGGGSSSSFGSGITSGTPISTVISTSTFGTCADVFTTYMRKGKTNNVTEVTRLQRLLGVKQTGFFGTLTQNAVNAFQLKYTDNVLKPWGTIDATGYFYKTTQRQMNMLLCPTVDFPMPVLN